VSRSPSRSLGRHRPALDGIRAIAVVAVLLYHGLVPWANGGFLGVDIFFVLSGYLITTILLTEWDKWGSIDVVGFYVRRARRLLPALFLLVVAISLWAAVDARPERLGRIRADGLSSLLYVTNWRFIFVKQSYFEQYGDPSPFLHMWSLAIEEQFYLIYPLMLISLLHVSVRRHWILPACLAGMAALSIAEMAFLYEPGTDTSRIYFGTDSRGHELLTGALLAVWMSRGIARRRSADPLTWRSGVVTRLATAVGLVGLPALLASLYWFSDQSAALYRGGFAVVCVVTAVVIASVELAPRGPVARLISIGPVVWVGTISYGLYLWHWPFYVVLTSSRTGLDGTALLAVRIAVTVVAATMSFYLVERPVRSGALRRMPHLVGRTVAAVAMPVALAALIGGTAGAVAPQLPESPFGPGAPQAGKNSLLLVGDSVGLSLADTFPETAYQGWDLQSSVKLGCGLAVQHLAFGEDEGNLNKACETILEDWTRAMAVTKASDVVLSIGAWEVFDHVIDGKIVSSTSPAYADYLGERLNEAHSVLTADGAHLYIPNVPCFDQPSYRLNGKDDIAPIRNDPERAAAVNAVIEDFAARHTKSVTVIDGASWLCPDGHYEADRDGVEVRYDGVHFTSEGGAMFWTDVLMPALNSARHGG